MIFFREWLLRLSRIFAVKPMLSQHPAEGRLAESNPSPTPAPVARPAPVSRGTVGAVGSPARPAQGPALEVRPKPSPDAATDRPSERGKNPTSLPATDQRRAEPAGMDLNLRTALDAHQKWKKQFQAVINGTAAPPFTLENLSIDQISRDDHCALGRWIYGIGGQKFGDSEIFQSLAYRHQAFHRVAGDILRTARAGDLAKAQSALNSDFIQHSQGIVMELARMYNETDDRTQRSQYTR